MKDKRGTTYKFGTTAAARQSDPADATRTFKWVLEEMRDTNDNYVRYEYFKDAGQIYPWKVKYTGSGTTGKMAVLTGRNFIGIDISAEYLDIARQRINAQLPLLESAA